MDVRLDKDGAPTKAVFSQSFTGSMRSSSAEFGQDLNRALKKPQWQPSYRLVGSLSFSLSSKLIGYRPAQSDGDGGQLHGAGPYFLPWTA